MKNNPFTTSLFSSITRSLSLILMVAFLIQTVPAIDKMKPEELIAKHLEAIGTAQARSSVKNRVITGTCAFSYRANGIGQTHGNVVMASEGKKSLIGMVFPEASYPHERVGYDGKSVSTGFIRPGIRTVLGDFLYSHNEVFKEGLIGGALNQSWPLLNITALNPKLGFDGTRKVNGKETYVLSYSPQKGSDLQIKLFFDSTTFQHVRSEYVQIISGQLGATTRHPLLGTPDDNSSRQNSTRYEIVEEFSDFKDESGLTLPHNYKLRLLINNQGGNAQFNWEFNLTQFTFDQKIPEGSFNVETFKEQ